MGGRPLRNRRIDVRITYLFMATPVYTSTARMSVTPANRTADMQSFNDGTTAICIRQSELIMSPSVLALALRDPAVARIVADEPDAVQYLQRFMRSTSASANTVLTVSFSSTDRDEAATMANAIVAAYQKYQIMPRQSIRRSCRDSMRKMPLSRSTH